MLFAMNRLKTKYNHSSIEYKELKEDYIETNREKAIK